MFTAQSDTSITRSHISIEFYLIKNNNNNNKRNGNLEEKILITSQAMHINQASELPNRKERAHKSGIRITKKKRENHLYYLQT